MSIGPSLLNVRWQSGLVWKSSVSFPHLHAGGSGQLAAFKFMQDPVEVEFIKAHAGLDIGDTAIGMHVKHVQVPIRPLLREIGHAHVTALASRPKLIGGARAHYPQDSIRKS